MKNESFYEKIDRENTYEFEIDPTKHPGYKVVKDFINQYDLYNKKCLEIGSSKGVFQDLIKDYTGLDIAESLREHYHKPYLVSKNARIDSGNDTYDAIMTYKVHEHIPELNYSLQEIHRVLKLSGVILFSPAWQCRPWAAKGYPVRKYSDFNFIEKLIKLSIPIRESILFRLTYILPKRFYRHILFLLGVKPALIKYRKLIPNWENFWMSDSDACNSIDPHDAILWFENNGFKCISHPMPIKSFFVRSEALIFQKVK